MARAGHYSPRGNNCFLPHIRKAEFWNISDNFQKPPRSVLISLEKKSRQIFVVLFWLCNKGMCRPSMNFNLVKNCVLIKLIYDTRKLRKTYKNWLVSWVENSKSRKSVFWVVNVLFLSQNPSQNEYNYTPIHRHSHVGFWSMLDITSVTKTGLKTFENMSWRRIRGPVMDAKTDQWCSTENCGRNWKL